MPIEVEKPFILMTYEKMKKFNNTNILAVSEIINVL